MKQDPHFHQALEALDDRIINTTQQPSLNEVISQSRRNLLKGGGALALCGLFPALLSPLAKAV